MPSPLSIPPEWWPTLIGTMERPLIREAMLMDLRWWRYPGRETWEDEDGHRWEPGQVPGRRLLARRWGVSPNAARSILSEPTPGRRPVDARSPPAPERTNADNRADFARRPPARRPLDAQVALLRGPGEPTPEEAALWQEICAGQALALGGSGRDSGMIRLQNLRAAVADHRIGPAGVREVARWVHESDDRHAVLLRDGRHDTPDTFLRPENALRYREAAAAWLARRTAPAPGVSPAAPRVATVAAPGVSPAAPGVTAPSGLEVFDMLYESISRTGTVPEPLHPDPRVARAGLAALIAIGGQYEIGQSTRFTLPDIRRRFITTYDRRIR